MDKLVRGITSNGRIRVFGALTTGVVQKAREIHNTTPVATAAFGRTLTATLMMGTMLKGEKENVSLQFKGDGPISTVLAVGTPQGTVKGYVGNNFVALPLKENGKLDVGGAIGDGYLTVIKDLKLKEPYIGKVELQTGEIAEDLTYYFATSEQTPSVVALGVLVDCDFSVKAAGGYIIQLMPEATEEDIVKLEQNLAATKSVTTLIEEGMGIEEILNSVMDGFEIKITDEITPEYKCDCNKERIERAIISLGKDEIEDIIKKEKKAEVTCYFCNTQYVFEETELREILSKNE